MADDAYLACYSSQRQVVGAEGQEILAATVVLLAACGRVGSWIGAILASVGVGLLLIIDPQRNRLENLNGPPFVRPIDDGVAKASRFAGFVNERLIQRAEPLAVGVESDKADDFFDRATIVVCAANRVTTAKALPRGLPVVDVGLGDGALDGSIRIWTPNGVDDAACPACYYPSEVAAMPDNGLLATGVAYVAAVAAQIVVQLVLSGPDNPFPGCNRFSIDTVSHMIKPELVLRRSDCEICAPLCKEIA